MYTAEINCVDNLGDLDAIAISHVLWDINQV